MSESPIKKPRAVPVSAAVVSICTICSGQFESRNKLFKHIAVCRVIDGNKVSDDVSNTVSRHLADSMDGDVHLYVLGGRLRGRTLRTCEVSFLPQLLTLAYSLACSLTHMCNYFLICSSHSDLVFV